MSIGSWTFYRSLKSGHLRHLFSSISRISFGEQKYVIHIVRKNHFWLMPMIIRRHHATMIGLRKDRKWHQWIGQNVKVISVKRGLVAYDQSLLVLERLSVRNVLARLCGIITPNRTWRPWGEPRVDVVDCTTCNVNFSIFDVGLRQRYWILDWNISISEKTHDIIYIVVKNRRIKGNINRNICITKMRILMLIELKLN